MNTKILAAITAAIAAYIQDEESAYAASGSKLNLWRLSGRLAQMNHKINAWHAVPPRGRDMWKCCGLERLIATRTG